MTERLDGAAPNEVLSRIGVGTRLTALKSGPRWEKGERAVVLRILSLGDDRLRDHTVYHLVTQYGGLLDLWPMEIGDAFLVELEPIPALRDYHYRDIIQMGRDYQAGVFSPAFGAPRSRLRNAVDVRL